MARGYCLANLAIEHFHHSRKSCWALLRMEVAEADVSLCCLNHEYSLAFAVSHVSFRASVVAQLVKNLPAVRETWVQSQGSSILL